MEIADSHPVHPLAWAHYADDHKGFCYAVSTESVSAKFRKVTYQTTPPTFSGTLNAANAICATTTKPMEWEGEIEWRETTARKAVVKSPAVPTKTTLNPLFCLLIQFLSDLSRTDFNIMTNVKANTDAVHAQEVGHEFCDVTHGWIKTGGLLGALASVLIVFGPLGLAYYLVDHHTDGQSASYSGNFVVNANPPLQRLLAAASVQLAHALAIVATGILLSIRRRVMLQVSAWCFFAGTLIYCGCQYGAAFTGIPMFEYVSMVGGLLLLCGWLALVEGGCPQCKS